LNTKETLEIVNQYGIKTLKADNSHDPPEIGQLLDELGNESHQLPFYAIYPAGSDDPIIIESRLITKSEIIAELKKAATSGIAGPHSSTAMNQNK